MGLGSSRMGPDRAGPARRRRPTIKRSISSLLICRASSSREIEDYPDELLGNSAEHGDREKLKFTRKGSDFSLGSVSDTPGIKVGNGVPPGRCLVADGNSTPHVNSSNIDKGKCLSECRELVPSCQFKANSTGNEAASTSYVDPPSPDSDEGSSQIVEALDNSNSLGEALSDEVPSENSVSESIVSSNSENDLASIVSDSPNLPRNDSQQVVMPSALGFLVSEREENRLDGTISIREARRNSRRLFWDAFSRRSSIIDSDSRSSAFLSNDSDRLRFHDRWLLDFSGDFFNEEVRGGIGSHRSRTQGTNEQGWNSRSEIWERLHGSLDSADLQSGVCPRGIHADSSCLCRSAEESGARAGISRIVLLAQALFEVLDQIHRQPMSLSLSMVSVPAPESVVDSFPVKIRRKEERLDCADDVSQCYICLAEYEEGDKIRVLPCHHEYHMSCVDKWLKEIHGVCPLCRGDVREGFTETSVSSREILSH